LNPQSPSAATQDAATPPATKLRPARWTSLWRDWRAVVALEYAIIAGVMVFVVFTVSSPFATALGNMFTHVTSEL
jgi:Flp pilus assembly pilin Flp